VVKKWAKDPEKWECDSDYITSDWRTQQLTVLCRRVERIQVKVEARSSEPGWQ
jgi:hypothetical protein